jgi:hypothetical protein
MARVQQRLADLRKRANRLRQEGKNDEAKQVQQQIRRIAQQVERFRQQRGGGQRDEAEQTTRNNDDKGDAEKVDVKPLVEQAYLRTLSRRPDASELSRSIEYVEGSSNAITGLRDLMWALVNTKEFILNH